MLITGRDRKPAGPGASFRKVRTARVVAVVALFGAASLSIGAGVVAGPVASAAPRLTPAESFAYYVLGEAVVPPGARVTMSVDSPLLDGPFETTGLRETDVHRFFFLDESPQAVVSFLEAHVPLDATQTQPASSGGSTGYVLGLSYLLPVSGPHQVQAELDYGATAVAGGAELRIDAQTVWEPDRPTSERAPTHGIVQVTGYSHMSDAMGSSGPVTFTVPGVQARSLVRALNALPLGPRSICMEDGLLFKIAIRPSKDSPPSFEADGWICPPDVTVIEHGRVMPNLYDVNCALLRAVVQVLPAHEANATRTAEEPCGPPLPAASAHASKIASAALARLTKIARSMAIANGDAEATDVQAVATTRAAALKIATPGDSTPSVPTDEPVYLITMRGLFTAHDSSPPGAALPTGSYLSIVVGRGTFQVTDWGLSSRRPSVALSSLGSVSRLSLVPAAKGKGEKGSLTTRLELSRTSVKAGTPIQGMLVVTNAGPSVNETHGCAPQLGVVLTNSKIPPIGIVPTYCELKQIWIRHGVNRLAIVVSTRFQVCAQTPAQATVRVPACLPGGMKMPPFPVGRYQAVAVGVWSNIPKPAPVTVTLRK